MLSRDADAILIGHMSGRRSEHYFYYQAPYKRGEFKAAMDKNHILIVEDDADIRSGIEIYLKNQGYDVSQAGDGIEGLAVIEKEEIDACNRRYHDATHGRHYNDDEGAGKGL